MDEKFLQLLKNYVSATELEWINSKISGEIEKIPVAFVSAPRFISKHLTEISSLYSDFEFYDGIPVFWPLDKVVRTYLILHLAADLNEKKIKLIESLFDTAEVNEAVALYGALPFLPESERWTFRATEAVRSNIGPVFDAIAFANPYPATHFSDPAWNQLILKCIFNDKPIHLISGLEKRSNRALSESVSNFAHERWAAGRTVPAQIWRLVSKFTDDQILVDLEKLFTSDNIRDQHAAALVCHDSISKKAGRLLSMYPTLSVSIKKGEISWNDLEN